MSSEKNKEISNEELARMMAEGFAGMATKEDFQDLKSDIAGLDNRLTVVEQNLSTIEENLSSVERRLTTVEHKVDRALFYESERVDKLEKKMDIVWNKLDLAEAA